MRRRSFLIGLAAAAAALAASAAVERRKLLGPMRNWLAIRGARLVDIRLDAKSGTGRLPEARIEALAVLGETIAPSWAAGDQVRGFFRRHVRGRSEGTPGYRKEYEEALVLLDETAAELRAGSSFASLERPDRDRVLATILGSSRGRSVLSRRVRYFLPEGRRANRFRRFVMRDMKEAYYLSPHGWRVVGYPVTPGDCNDLVSYTRPPATPAGAGI